MAQKRWTLKYEGRSIIVEAFWIPGKRMTITLNGQPVEATGSGSDYQFEAMKRSFVLRVKTSATFTKVTLTCDGEHMDAFTPNVLKPPKRH